MENELKQFIFLDFLVTKQSEKEKRKKKEVKVKNKKTKRQFDLPGALVDGGGGVSASGAFGSVEEGETQGDDGVNEMSSRLGLEAVNGEIEGRREKARSSAASTSILRGRIVGR